MVLVRRQRDLADLVAGKRGVDDRGADLLVAHLDHELVAGVGALQLRPAGEQLAATRGSSRASRSSARPSDRADGVGLDRIRLGQHARALAQLLHLARQPRLRPGPASCSRAPRRRCRRGSARGRRGRSAPDGCCAGSPPAAACRRSTRQAERRQPRQHRLVERGHAVVVEAAGHRAEHRHLVGLLAERLAVALHLLGDVAQRVGRALAVELVDGDELGEVEHVDLLELAGGAELRRHHVHRHVDQRHDRRVALADARGLDDHQVEAGDLAPPPARRAGRR